MRIGREYVNWALYDKLKACYTACKNTEAKELCSNSTQQQ